jgi:cell division protein FtsW (lipid II flippase)
MDERPRAPWHPVPLVELSVLAGIVLLVLGFVNWDSDSGRAMLIAGLLLGSLGGLDTVLREHFSGFRSHSTVLAGVPGVGLAAILYFAGAPWPVLVLGAVAAFAGSFILLVRTFRPAR